MIEFNTPAGSISAQISLNADNTVDVARCIITTDCDFLRGKNLHKIFGQKTKKISAALWKNEQTTSFMINIGRLPCGISIAEKIIAAVKDRKIYIVGKALYGDKN